MSKMSELPFLGAAELGYMLEVNRQRVGQLSAQPGFPEPVELRMGKVWWTEDIKAWAARKGRVLRQLPASWPRAGEADVEGGAATSTSKYRP